MIKRQNIENETLDDTQLARLTVCWQDIEPVPDFTAAVLRRIRTEAAVASQGVSFADWLRLPDWLSLPASIRMPALALIALFLLAGGMLGVVSGLADVGRRLATEQPLLASHTLAGSYASLATRGIQ